MATRRAVGASIASAVIFSSLLVSNFVLYSGAAQDFRYASLAAEVRDYQDQALVVRSIALLDLLDGAQDLLSSGHFTCSNVSYSIANLLSSERVRLGWGGLFADSFISPAPDQTLTDNLTSLNPFDGSVETWTNLKATALVQGRSPDGSLLYNRSEEHLLNLPLRLRALTTHCLDAVTLVHSTLGNLGGQLCNASVVSGALSSVAQAATASARSDGFVVSVFYAITPGQSCQVAFRVSASQESVPGPEGPFTFTEEESGSVSP